MLVEIHQALVDKISLPVILSRVDRQVNLRNKGKGKATEASPPSTSFPSVPTPTPSAPSTTEAEVEVEAEIIDRTPADGISELQPAPTPIGLVPSLKLPSKPEAPRIIYDLPDGLTIKDCTIFYIGGESLGLNNLLMTHGTCAVGTSVKTVWVEYLWIE